MKSINIKLFLCFFQDLNIINLLINIGKVRLIGKSKKIFNDLRIIFQKWGHIIKKRWL